MPEFFLKISDSVIAHTVKVSGNVAGTWHVEPNHAPKSGEPAQVWIALTQAGGTIVPLADCQCELGVYRQGSDQRILQPLLQAIAAEQSDGIPGATVIFPTPGAYTLQLTGKPKPGKSFDEFVLRYDVTVGAGSQVPEIATSPTPVSDRPPDGSISLTLNGVIIGALSLGVVATVLGIWYRRTKKRS